MNIMSTNKRIKPYRHRPRITKCKLTNMWILNRFGGKHECGMIAHQWEEAARSWETLMHIVDEEYGEWLKS
jgi:hypothetical protein